MGGYYHDCEITYDYTVVFLSDFFEMYEIVNPDIDQKIKDLEITFNLDSDKIKEQIEEIKESKTMTWSQVESNIKYLEKQLDNLKEKFKEDEDNLGDQLEDSTLIVYIPKLPNFAVNGKSYIRKEDYTKVMKVLELVSSNSGKYKLNKPKNVPKDALEAAVYLEKFYKEEYIRISNNQNENRMLIDDKIHEYFLKDFAKYNPEEQSFNEFKKNVEWYSKINLPKDSKKLEISFQYGSTTFNMDYGTQNIYYDFYDAECKLDEILTESRKYNSLDDPSPNWNDMFVFRNFEEKTLTYENGNVSTEHVYKSAVDINSVLEIFNVEFKVVKNTNTFILES